MTSTLRTRPLQSILSARVMLPLCLALASASAWAQDAQTLYAQGNAAYAKDECVRAAARYYALQVGFPESLTATISSRLSQRIRWCEDNSAIFAGGKGDGSAHERPRKPADAVPDTLASPSRDRCDLYATLAVTQYRINRQDKCGHEDSRWSDDFNSHRDWCEGASNKALDVENMARQDGLKACHK